MYRLEDIKYDDDAQSVINQREEKRKKKKKEKKEKRKKKFEEIKSRLQEAIDEVKYGPKEGSEDPTTCSEAEIKLGSDVDAQCKKYEEYKTIKKLQITGEIKKGITSDQINIIDCFEKAKVVSIFGVNFDNVTFDQLMTKIKDVKTVEWTLCKFKGKASDYNPTSSSTKSTIKNMNFWMKKEGIQYVEHFAQQTDMKTKLRKVVVRKDSISNIDNFDESTMFKGFESINLDVKDKMEF